VLTHLLNGLGALGNGDAIIYLVAGSLIGMVFGAIPGLGGAVILSIVLAFIYHISITGTLCLFLAVQAGSYYSASVSSILLNTPAHPEAFAVTLDGFPMARRGEAGRALGISAMSTCVGGVIGCVVLVGFFQIINVLPEIFHPPEYVALIVIAMLLVGTLGTNLVSKALISVALGLLIASVGTSVSGAPRYTFGTVGLEGGLSLVAIALGTFALPQMIFIFGTASAVAKQDMLGRMVVEAAPIEVDKSMYKQVFRGLVEPWHHAFVLVRASLVGVLTGVVPGIGGFTANFLSYGIAQQGKRRRHLLGTGIPEGIIAAEGSSLSKEAGGMIPLLGLGLPGGVGNALFLSALAIKDLPVSFGFVGTNPTISYEIVWIIAFGGIIGTFAGVLLTPLLARVTKVPGPVLLPLILSISIVGTFVATTTYFDVVEMFVFCCIGLALRRLQYSLASFAIGLVLGPNLETNVYQTHAIYPGLSFLTQRPLADFLVLIAIAILVQKGRQTRRDARGAKKALATSVLGEDVEGVPALTASRPFPLLEMLVSGGLVVLATFWFVYGATHYKLNSALMPCIGSGILFLASVWRVGVDVPAYVRQRRATRADSRLRSAATLVEMPVRPLLVGAMASELGIRGEVGIDLGEEGAPVDETTGRDVAQGSDERRGRRRPAPPVGDHAWGWHGQYSRELAALVWIASAIGLCYIFGFSVGIPAICALYGLLATRRLFATWRGQLLFTVLSSAAMWAMAHSIISVLHLYVVAPVRL
jgi:putative tricarboxylic transport membrane protein